MESLLLTGSRHEDSLLYWIALPGLGRPCGRPDAGRVAAPLLAAVVELVADLSVGRLLSERLRSEANPAAVLRFALRERR
jgi:hypothetical protein